MHMRTVKRIHDSIRDDIGSLETRRPLPGRQLEELDPFLFLNHHGPQVYAPRNEGLPFGPHPHRGFETVTFIVAGSLEHRDTAGHQSVISAGGVQWMTAGRGVEHSELSPETFRREGGPLEILQLWVNLPSRLKMTEPRYIGLQHGDIPQIRLDDGRATLHLIAGWESGATGPVEPLTDLVMASLTMSAGGRVTLPIGEGRTVFLYVVRGALQLGGAAAGAFQLVEWNDDGDAITLEAAEDSLVLFGHAAPLKEPVVAHGPFVMNTREEIVQAIQDYQAGMFR